MSAPGHASCGKQIPARAAARSPPEPWGSNTLGLGAPTSSGMPLPTCRNRAARERSRTTPLRLSTGKTRGYQDQDAGPGVPASQPDVMKPAVVAQGANRLGGVVSGDRASLRPAHLSPLIRAG
jgi:hypothetical protein